jgi:hypothetical protein
MHEVRLVFRPNSFKIGAAITLLATILLAVGTLARSRGFGQQNANGTQEAHERTQKAQKQSF